jgi:hypothetical protein
VQAPAGNRGNRGIGHRHGESLNAGFLFDEQPFRFYTHLVTRHRPQISRANDVTTQDAAYDTRRLVP